MPRKTKMTVSQLKADSFLLPKLTIPLADVEKRVKAGEELFLEESLFSDSIDNPDAKDYSALLLGAQQIAFMAGY